MLKRVQMEPYRRPPAGPALRRPAAARGAGARPDHRSAGPAARRAPVGARSLPAHQDARGAEAPADAAGHQLHPCDAQPGRGDGAGRPRRGDERRQDRAGGHRRARSSTSRPRPSSPSSSAATTCCPPRSRARQGRGRRSSPSAPTASSVQPGNAAESSVTSLQGVTRSVEYLGSTVQVGVDVMGLETLVGRACRRRASTRNRRCAPGEPVVLSWTPEDVHVLRAKGGGPAPSQLKEERDGIEIEGRHRTPQRC